MACTDCTFHVETLFRASIMALQSQTARGLERWTTCIAVLVGHQYQRAATRQLGHGGKVIKQDGVRFSSQNLQFRRSKQPLYRNSIFPLRRWERLRAESVVGASFRLGAPNPFPSIAPARQRTDGDKLIVAGGYSMVPTCIGNLMLNTLDRFSARMNQ